MMSLGEFAMYNLGFYAVTIMILMTLGWYLIIGLDTLVRNGYIKTVTRSLTLLAIAVLLILASATYTVSLAIDDAVNVDTLYLEYTTEFNKKETQ